MPINQQRTQQSTKGKLHESTLYINTFESEKRGQDNHQTSITTGGGGQNPSFIKTIMEPKTLLNELMSPQINDITFKKVPVYEPQDNSRWQQLAAKNFNPDRTGFKHRQIVISQKQTVKGQMLFELKNMSQDHSVTNTPLSLKHKSVKPLDTGTDRHFWRQPPATSQHRKSPRCPEIGFTNSNLQQFNIGKSSSTKQQRYKKQSQEKFDKYQLIDPLDVLRTSGNDKIQDQNLKFQGMVHNPAIRTQNIHRQGTAGSMPGAAGTGGGGQMSQMSSRSALTQIKNYQHQRLKKMQKKFTYSITKVDALDSQEANMSAEIQQLISRRRGMSINLQNNLFKSQLTTPSIDMITTSNDKRGQLQSQKASGRYDALNPRNDYRAFMKSHGESLTALNTNNKKLKKPAMSNMEQYHQYRTRNLEEISSMQDMNSISKGKTPSQDNIQIMDNLITMHDSIMSHEFNLRRLKEAKQNGQMLITNDQFNSVRSQDDQSINSQLILTQVLDAQKSEPYLNQPKIDRLMAMDQIINSSNHQFKESILSKFQKDYIKKQMGSNKDYDNNIGWMIKDIRQSQGKRLHQLLRNAQYKIRMDSINKSSIDLTSTTKKDSPGDAGSPEKQNLLDTVQEEFDDNSAIKSPRDQELYVDDCQKTIPPELKQQAEKTCEELDKIIESKKMNVKNNVRRLRIMIDGGECSKEDDENLENPLTASIEKKRRRVINQFETKIKRKKQMLEDVENFIEMKIEPDVRASKILSNLNGKDRDPEINEAYEEIQPKTALFLADLVSDIMDETQRHNMIKDLTKQLDDLMDSRDEYDEKMRFKIMLRLSEEGIRNLLAKGVQDLANEAILHTKGLFHHNDRRKCQFQIHSEPIFDQKFEKKLTTKKPLRFQKMVQKNFQKIVNQRVDMGYMTKILSMLQQFEAILGTDNIGEYYTKISRNNLWENDFLRDNDFPIDFLSNQKKLHDFNQLYNTEVMTQTFYKDIKVKMPHLLDESETEKLASLHFQNKLENAYQRSLPTFAQMNNNQLFLNEIVISDEMAQGLSEYLKAMKSHPDKIAKALFIENCSMRDEQLATIFQGINAQGNHLITFVYSSGELYRQAAKEIQKQIPNLRNFHLNNMTRNFSVAVIQDLLAQFVDKGYVLSKLKLSRMNICDTELVNSICRNIEDKQTLIHLDLSWAKLMPKQMNTIILQLINLSKQSLKNLNLAYNSLVQPPLDESINFNYQGAEYVASKEFVANLCLYMVENPILNHLDVSGMNFSKQQILQVAETAITQTECLLAIHLSDNGIRFDQEVRDEILDMMGLSTDIFKILSDDAFTNNQRIIKTENMRKMIRSHNMSLNANDFDNFALSDANIYANRMVQTKMGKNVIKQMNQHKVQTNGGVGRLESSLVDQFILSRRVNSPELVFNQQPYIDRYYEMDSSEHWRLVDTACGISGGCPICNKHKYTMIFYEQDMEEPWSFNEGLIEVTDKEQLNQLQEDLNISFRYQHEIAPIIVGTVVMGGFKRKLRMIRADYFSMLSVSQSIHTVNSVMQIRAIKRGLTANLLKSQNMPVEDPHLTFLKGWQKQLIVDKCLKNEVEDVCLVNFPSELRPKQQQQPKVDLDQSSMLSMESPAPKVEDLIARDKNCTTFVYAAYLPPGQHQFLIWCPKTKRAFVKDFVVDLNECEPFPEYPEQYQPPNKVKKPTRQNVWRQWRNDSDENIKMAFINDIQRPDGSHFCKDLKEQQLCNEILIKNFTILQVVFMEIITQSPMFYPKIPFMNLFQKIYDQQKTDEERKTLERSQIELAFMGATKFDGVKGVSGSLHRGQFFEIIIRLCHQRYSREKQSVKLQDFINYYIKPVFDTSQILPIRKQIRDSKQLNQLLFDNKKGLMEFYLDYKEYPQGFTYLSSTKLLNPLDDNAFDGAQLIPEMQKHFYIAKMTILKDREDHQMYHTLEYVEYLDFICRVGIELWMKDGMDESSPVHKMVYYLLNKLWYQRIQHPDLVPIRPIQKGEEKLEQWPELVPVMELDQDDDD